MKVLKFQPQLAEQILSGAKTKTWRLFDDKNLTEGDHVVFINKETDTEFGDAVLISIEKKTFGTLDASDWDGHEQYASEAEMYKTYRGYYGNRVDADSEVKVLSFKFKAREDS